MKMPSAAALLLLLSGPSCAADPAAPPAGTPRMAQAQPDGRAPGKPFPAHWGPPPQIQTRDHRPLPGGYGFGSSTLAHWIQANLDRDRAGAAAPPALTGACELRIAGTGFLLDGRPFPFTGVSFFNAIYNPAFNRDSTARREWLRKFQGYGINVLRIWAQWDNQRGFVDASPASTLYHPDGGLRAEHLATLKAMLDDARAEGVVVQLCLFSHESFREGTRLPEGADARAVEAVARELKPWRNLTLQLWNEHHDDRVLPLVRVIRAADPRRLVTSSPGFAGVLGPRELNLELDYLTPHTSRQGGGKTWELAPREIASLLAAFKKPVVDDEPARNGTPNFGGPKQATAPTDHILHIWEVWKAGGHPVYHHDMFQTGYGTPACPPHGIPDPEFSPYHRQVFEFLKQRARYQPEAGAGKTMP